MATPTTLIPGRYYEVIYRSGSGRENLFLVKAESNDWVKVLWDDGEKAPESHSGTIGGASSIKEISRRHAEAGYYIPETNLSAKSLLEKEW
jgi:hypothetical protein